MIPIANIDNFNTASQQVVTAATNATPIVITTAAVHGWAVGDVVTIQGGLVNTGVNGTFKLSVIGSTTTATLLDSAGTGTYTASTATATKLNTTTSWHSALQAVCRAILDDHAAGN